MSPDPRKPNEPPERDPTATYNVYRSRPRARPTEPPEPPGKEPRQPRQPRQRRQPRQPRQPRPKRQRKKWTLRRIIKTVVLAVIGWVLLSFVIFLFSAQFLQDQVDSKAKAALNQPGLPIISPTNVLILGSDLRAKGTKEPGAATSGPSRSDSIQLMRVGGGDGSKLSIPRDTVVDIPGYGLNKVNAAFAFGGAELSIRTLRSYLGIEINHVIVVNFDQFPNLIDSMGGIDFTGGCVISKINGGFANGGYTLRLKAGTNHIDGKQALALARTRKNECNSSYNDLTRVVNQQKIISAMRSRLHSPFGFIRWPFIAWSAPQTISSDMGAAGLLGLAATIGVSGGGSPAVLKPDGAVTLPDGGAGLTVSPDSRERQVQKFLDG
ncbi:MAG: LCP family protein [Solirubrobacteraceae bacterium]|nr:LCP family protein [Solirubrobacteraceae bacterium]